MAFSPTTGAVSTVPALTPAIAGRTSPTGSAVAVLGDSEERYVARLGRPGADSIPGAADHFARIPDTTCDQFVVFFTGRVARAIVRQTCAGPVPSPQDRRTEAGGFAPSDRVPGNPFQTSNGEQAMAYTSQALAAELPASAFHDCNGSALPAGTFAIFLTANGWEVAAGTCP